MELIIGVIALLFFLFLIYRNGWVCEKRLELTDICHNTAKKLISADVYKFDSDKHWYEYYNRYWSYDKMLYHFWIWDVEEMKD